MSQSATLSTTEAHPNKVESEIIQRILKALSGLEYGSVEIIVQDSKVVQIERTQRARFSRPLEIPDPS